MLYQLFQIIASLNLAYLSILLYEQAISHKDVVFNSYYGVKTQQTLKQIEQINNVLSPILYTISQTPELRVYRYTDSSNCPLILSEEQCQAETCNILYIDDAPTHNVDLTYMGEKYTGQQGQNIWLSIYEDLNNETSSKQHEHMVNLIKGIHSSISVSITEQFEIQNRTEPNVDFFFWRVGYYPDRIYNVYFVYEFLISASKKLNLTSQYLEISQNSKDLINLLLSQYKDIPNLQFDYFNNVNQDDLKLYRNDTELLQNYMDCVHCKRCKVNGKVQIHGLELGLDLLFEPQKQQHYEKNDYVAFLNTFNKISQSITSIDNMFIRKYQSFNLKIKYTFYCWILILVINILRIMSYEKNNIY